MNRYMILVMSLLASPVVFSQGPNDSGAYYQAADGKRGVELKTALFRIVSPHTVVSYTPGVWQAVNSYDLRDDGKIWDIYSGISNFTPGDDQNKGVEGKEGDTYNREHAMPRSWFKEANQENNTTKVYPMYTDLHHLFPTDTYVNGLRSNYPYGELEKGANPTKQSEGGFSKFGICDPAIGYVVVNGKARVFEPADEYKGDLARVYFYMATAYESYKNEKGIERSPADWDSSDKTMLDGTVFPFFKPWALNMLLRWAWQDPVSEKEIRRNEAIFGIQNNRNPFVDYPRLEQYIWGVYADEAFSYDHYVQPETTAINGIVTGQSVDGRWYDLRGRRVTADRPRKGVYIRNKRKVVIN